MVFNRNCSLQPLNFITTLSALNAADSKEDTNNFTLNQIKKHSYTNSVFDKYFELQQKV